jgi:hypothetical protein
LKSIVDVASGKAPGERRVVHAESIEVWGSQIRISDETDFRKRRIRDKPEKRPISIASDDWRRKLNAVYNDKRTGIQAGNVIEPTKIGAEGPDGRIECDVKARADVGDGKNK